jgi:hypothetical protein
MQQPERRTRFERERPPGLAVTDRDIAILEATGRHRFVRSTHLQTLMPEEPPAKILRRLHKLYHNGYVDRPRAQIDYHQAGGGSKPMVYGLTSRGERLLAEETGKNPRRRDTNTTRLFLEHTLAVTDFMVALEGACRERGALRVIEPDEILVHASERVQRQPNPFMWETRVRWGGEEHRIHVAPDKVFGIEDAGGSRRYYFLEMDRGTMPVARGDLRRTSLLRKFLSYDATFRDSLHRRLYGLPGFQVLTVTTGEKRITRCRELLLEVAPECRAAKRFLFTVKPAAQEVCDQLSLFAMGHHSVLNLQGRLLETQLR